jgi:hypothetical protein
VQLTRGIFAVLLKHLRLVSIARKLGEALLSKPADEAAVDRRASEALSPLYKKASLIKGVLNTLRAQGGDIQAFVTQTTDRVAFLMGLEPSPAIESMDDSALAARLAKTPGTASADAKAVADVKGAPALKRVESTSQPAKGKVAVKRSHWKKAKLVATMLRTTIQVLKRLKVQPSLPQLLAAAVSNAASVLPAESAENPQDGW